VASAIALLFAVGQGPRMNNVDCLAIFIKHEDDLDVSSAASLTSNKIHSNEIPCVDTETAEVIIG
jgi:hypothetical protein